MKQLLALSALTLALGVGTASAGPTADKQKLTGLGKFTAGALVGGLVGGPLGAVIGAAGGGISADQSAKATATQAELHRVRANAQQLEEDIAMQQALIAELEQQALARMELEVFFDTGVDQVSALDQERLRAVADYLVEHADINIGLDGHADPRGTDEYNNVLSRERALAVKALLLSQGVDESRIRVTGHGSSQAITGGASASSYAIQRRVDIILEPGEHALTQSSWRR